MFYPMQKELGCYDKYGSVKNFECVHQCATLAAGPGPEASENVVRPVKKGPGTVKISLIY